MSIDNIGDITPRVQYVAAASQTAFDYPFPIFEETDLRVDVDGDSQVLSTDYTVSGVTDDTGGTVTFTSGLSAGSVVTLWRDTSIQRTTDYQQNGPLRSSAINDDFDRLTVIAQELESRIGRSLQYPVNDTNSNGELADVATRKGKYLFFDAVTGAISYAVNVVGTVLTQLVFNLFLAGSTPYKRTSAEIAAGVTPTDYGYPPGDCRRFGVSTSATAAANAAAFNNALLVGGKVFLEGAEAAGTYVVDDNLDVRSNTVFRIGAGVTIQGAASKAWADTGILDINSRANVTVKLYGTIDGNKANNATGRAFGIRLISSTDVSLIGNGAIQNCPGTSSAGTLGGDGIYIGGAGTARIFVGELLLSGNVRQGASITRGEDITFVGTKALNTTGTDPGSGFDVENDISSGLTRIKFIGCQTDGCYRGFQLADASSVQLIGCTTRNNRFIDLNVVRVTDLYAQLQIGSVVPTVAQDASVYCLGVHNAKFDLQIDGNYDPQQGTALRLVEACSDIQVRIQARETYSYAIAIGGNAMASDVTDVTVQGCKFVDCVDSSSSNAVIFLDGNSGGGFYPKRITIVDNQIYDSRTGGNEASAGIEFSSNIPDSVKAGYEIGPNSIVGTTAKYTGAPNYGSFNGTLTGFAAGQSTTVWYTREGNFCALRFSSASATSTTNAMTMTGLPQYLWPSTSQRVLVTGLDNGITQTLACTVDTAGGVTFNLAGLGAFTAAGTKGLQISTILYPFRP